MPNKRSGGGQRNRKLLGDELATFLADISDLAADLGGARGPREDHRATEAPAEAEAALEAPAEAEAALEAPAEAEAEAALEAPAAEAEAALEAPAEAAATLEVIEELPSVSTSYLPPLPPEDEPDADASAAPPARSRAAGESGDGEPSHPEQGAPERDLPTPAGDLAAATGAGPGSPEGAAGGLTLDPAGLLGGVEELPIPSGTSSRPAVIPGGLPALVSRRPWSLAAAMEPLEPLCPPPSRPLASASPAVVAAPRPPSSPSQRLLPQVHLPVLPAVVLAMLAVVIVLLVLRLTSL